MDTSQIREGSSLPVYSSYSVLHHRYLGIPSLGRGFQVLGVLGEEISMTEVQPEKIGRR